MLLCIRGVVVLVTLAVARGGTPTTIAGYETFGTNDVTKHLKIDLDMQKVITLSGSDLSEAFKEYSVGNDLHLHYPFFIRKQILMLL
jgi:hypothetical protein